MFGLSFPPTRYIPPHYSHNVKHLQDLCLRCIGEHLDTIPTVSRYLAPRHKELLLEQLVNHDRLTPAYLPHVTYNMFSASMTKLNFYKCEQVTDALLKTLSLTGCKLEWICIHDCPNVTDEGIKMLTKSQTEINRLELRKMSKLTDKGLTNIDSKQLEVLDFRGCTSLSSQGVRDVLKKNHGVKILNLATCNHLDEKVIHYIATHMGDRLESLDMTGLHFVNNEGLISLAQSCPNLKMLGIHGAMRVTSEGANTLFAGCQQMKFLDLSYCTNIQEPLQRLPENLQELSLCGVMIDNEDLFIASVSRLHKLTLARFCGVPALNDRTLTEIMAKIGKNLSHLDLSGSVMSTLSDHGLRSIGKYCTQLESLALSLLKDITGESLIRMFNDKSRAEAISCLLLSCKQLKSELVDVIAGHCTGLETLNVAGLSFVDDILLTRIAENCPNLNHVNLKGCRNVTDEGIIVLARHCPLKICIFSGVHQITNRSIIALANSCPYIEELYLNGCALISPEAVAYLKDQCIPRVFTTHKTPNASGDQCVGRNLDTGNYGLAPVLP